MSFGTWLRDLRSKEKDMGVDHRDMACRADKLTPHVRDHLAHAAQEIEALYTSLPPDVTPEWAQRIHWEDGREAYVARVVTILQHLGSALTAVGCTDSELSMVSHNGTVQRDAADNARAPLMLLEACADDEEEDCDETVTVVVPTEMLTGVRGGKK